MKNTCIAFFWLGLVLVASFFVKVDVHSSPAQEYLRGLQVETEDKIDVLQTISGGDDVSEGGAFVELFASDASGSNTRRCGGLLIDSELAITAASCCYDSTGNPADLSQSKAYLTDDTTETQAGIRLDWEAFSIHPNYEGLGSTLDNIAMIKFTKEVNPTPGSGIPISSPDPEPGDNVSAEGFGKTSAGGSDATFLQEVSLSVVAESNSGCSTGAEEKMICAAGSGNKGMCEGDEGGPLKFRNTGGANLVHGLYSHGGSCDGSSVAKFVRLSYYIDELNRDENWYTCTYCDFLGNPNLDICDFAGCNGCFPLFCSYVRYEAKQLMAWMAGL